MRGSELTGTVWVRRAGQARIVIVEHDGFRWMKARNCATGRKFGISVDGLEAKYVRAEGQSADGVAPMRCGGRRVR